MEYKYSEKENFEDLSSGRVIYSNAGVPNFSVRLVNEMFRRCLNYTEKKSDITLYDPCCGGGYSLTVLGFCNSDVIGKAIGSDINPDMIAMAKKNLSLLTEDGQRVRENELNGLVSLYGKESHKQALQGLDRLKGQMEHEISSVLFTADCTKGVPADDFQPDIILTDVPYGNLVTWGGDTENHLDQMMEELSKISGQGTVLAVSMDKKQKIACERWKRVEKHMVGKRKFEIYVRV